MPNYRKRPVVIEAEKWQPSDDAAAKALILWALGFGDDPDQLDIVDDQLHLRTLEGVMVASPGDWIIRGVQGELYPCKPDIFAQTYEPVE